MMWSSIYWIADLPPANRAAEPSRGAVTPAAGAFPIVIRVNETVLFILLLIFLFGNGTKFEKVYNRHSKQVSRKGHVQPRARYTKFVQNNLYVVPVA